MNLWKWQSADEIRAALDRDSPTLRLDETKRYIRGAFNVKDGDRFLSAAPDLDLPRFRRRNCVPDRSRCIA